MPTETLIKCIACHMLATVLNLSGLRPKCLNRIYVINWVLDCEAWNNTFIILGCVCITGAGGSKVRPDVGKQRSLSGTPSPCHSRSASASSDLANIVRSSSEGNLADPSELAERLKQGRQLLWNALYEPCIEMKLSPFIWDTLHVACWHNNILTTVWFH